MKGRGFEPAAVNPSPGDQREEHSGCTGMNEKSGRVVRGNLYPGYASLGPGRELWSQCRTSVRRKIMAKVYRGPTASGTDAQQNYG